MGRRYLGQLENGSVLEDTALLDLEIQKHAGDAVLKGEEEMEFAGFQGSSSKFPFAPCHMRSLANEVVQSRLHR